MTSLRTLLLASAVVLACSSGSTTTGTTTPPTPPSTSGGETPPPTTATNTATPPTTPPDTTPPTPPTTPTTPTTPATPTGAGTASAELITRGQQRFGRVCGACHEDGSDGPRANLGWAEDRMRTMVRNGNARMRAIPATRLTDADLDAVIAYLRSIHAVS